MATNAALPVSPRTTPRPVTIWVALILALIAGAGGWALIQAIHPVFKVPEEFHIVQMGPSPEKVAAWQDAVQRTDRKNAMLYFGVLGALLAAGVSAARRSVLAVVAAAPLGLVLGALAGLVGTVAHERWGQAQGEMAQIAAAQAVLLGGLGLAVGLPFGVAGRSLSAIVLASLGGLAAGALAGLVYPVGMSLLMPAVDTQPMIPLETTSRLIWIELTAGLLGLIIPLSTRPRRPNEASAAAVP